MHTTPVCARILRSLLHFWEVFLLNKHFGHRIRILHWCTDQAMTTALSSMELTSAQGHIMGYLAHRAAPPCAKDIEEVFHLSHPTVSGLLARLEKKGFIQFRPDENDRRCKRIFLLEKGRQCQELMHNTIRNNENQMVMGFTEEEKAQFSALLDRAITNMGGSPCQRQHKEES